MLTKKPLTNLFLEIVHRLMRLAAVPYYIKAACFQIGLKKLQISLSEFDYLVSSTLQTTTGKLRYAC